MHSTFPQKYKLRTKLFVPSDFQVQDDFIKIFTSVSGGEVGCPVHKLQIWECRNELAYSEVACKIIYWTGLCFLQRLFC